ncbi:APGWamide (AKA: Cterminally located anterior lobe peptide (CALP)) [Biomphalaria pfeifferi]|uniref:APGWamide (AKA: Cterminally located anterior lobe peptide (CALP)) n=1 Tax=Biomphalaria pfeifferi TaxID=112525 RepID=A0AAD8CCD0_BIOPF|nr:APGWamide (AKA: Cterminally located anterior lobe peptide (CALP)) [Biomphalaria pfeifferi]
MRAHSVSFSSVLLAQIVLLAASLLVKLVNSAESSIDTAAQTSSSSESLHTPASRYKRAPGWGKRNGFSEELLEDNENTQELMARLAEYKRAPGWGKRTSSLDIENALSADKKAPGWGKRNLGSAFEDDANDLDKRAPGWGKRAPGWGKRAPGWGKRAPGWGKRAPGWGKRSVDDYCQTLDQLMDEYIHKALEVKGKKMAECGSTDETNEPLRK